jgi:hypothetical protein
VDWRNWSISDWGNAVWLAFFALGPIVLVAAFFWEAARKLWRGEFSLPAAFWLFFAVGNFIVIPIVTFAFLWVLLWFVDAMPGPVKVAIVAAWWVYFAITVVGVWRSAKSNVASPIRLSRVWGYAARCVVLILAIGLMGNVIHAGTRAELFTPIR